MKASIQKYTFAIPKPYYTTIYAETHTPVTNENGLVSIAIGTGTLVPWSIPFKDINWGAETYYLRTDIDLSGGSTYTISSTQQLLSVPYSLTSKTAVKADTASKAAVADMAKKIMVRSYYGFGDTGKIEIFYFKTGYSSPLSISASELALSNKDMDRLIVLSMEVGWGTVTSNSTLEYRGLKDGITYENRAFNLGNDFFFGLKIYFPEKTEYYDKEGRIVYMLLE